MAPKKVLFIDRNKLARLSLDSASGRRHERMQLKFLLFLLGVAIDKICSWEDEVEVKTARGHRFTYGHDFC